MAKTAAKPHPSLTRQEARFKGTLTLHLRDPIRFWLKPGEYKAFKIVPKEPNLAYVVRWGADGRYFLTTPLASGNADWAPGTYDLVPIQSRPTSSGSAGSRPASQIPKASGPNSIKTQVAPEQSAAKPDAKGSPPVSSSEGRATQEQLSVRPTLPPVSGSEPETNANAVASGANPPPIAGPPPEALANALPPGAAPPPATGPPPEARANSGPSSGASASREGAGGLLQSMRSLADRIDAGIDQVNRSSMVIDRKLGELVEDQGSLGAVIGANVAADVVGFGRFALDLAKGFTDPLRIGMGIEEGGWGYAKDAMRVAAIAGPAVKVFGAGGSLLIKGGEALVEMLNKGSKVSGMMAKQQREFVTSVARLYRGEIERLIQECGHWSNSKIGKEADDFVKREIQKLYPALEIAFEEQTGVTYGILKINPGTFMNIDIVVKELKLAVELKKSFEAVRDVQKAAHLIYARLMGYRLYNVYGHL